MNPKILFETVSPNEYPERDMDYRSHERSVQVPLVLDGYKTGRGHYNFTDKKWFADYPHTGMNIIGWLRPAPQGKYKEVEKRKSVQLPGDPPYPDF